MTNERERLAAVRRYDILDTPPDGAFDRVTALAARRCRTPIAIVSVVDTDRIWFKSRHGLELEEIGREPGLCASAILGDGPWIVEDARTDPRTVANSLVAGDFGLAFYLGIPLRTSDGYNLGTLCVLDFEPRRVDDQEVADLQDLASIVVDQLELRRAARQRLALEMQLREQAEKLARSLQDSLLPPRLPDVEGLELAARYLPAERARVGGDFYDAFESDGSVGFVVGDVCGHGPGAATLTGIARHTVRVLATGAWSPADVLDRTNQAMLASGSVTDDRFCTIALLRLERADDPDAAFHAVVGLGGHPPPRLVRPDGEVRTLGTAGSLVGALSLAEYTDVEVPLRPGDLLVLFTDGLTDAGAGAERFDERVLDRTLSESAGRSAQEVADALLAAVGALARPARDDIAIFVARVLG